MAKVEGFIIGIPEWICSDQIVRIGVGKPLWDRPWTIKDTLALLPNLVHLENTMSAYYRKYLATIGASCTGASRTGASLMLSRDLDQEFVSDRAFVFLKGVQEVVSHMTETITSLKLCEVVAIDTDTFLNFPKNLQHLDLNLQLLWTLDEDRVPVLEKTIMEAWRKILKALTQLKSLRLTFECGKDHYADGHIHEDSPLSSDPLYMDDLLINPRDSADQSYFARLTSLRLVNCYLRVRGLQAIATRHNGTLKELELSRVTFDPLYCVGSWSEIGAMCHEALPNLRYLRLAKLITWFPNVRFEGEPEREAVPNRWNSGLEGATSYKWIKNGRGSGADYEFIGSKCPWLG